ncbi:hypothetical protein [Thermaerobacillus caldiproteolyticus]|jgi:hypothetical protein|uniref:Uncharacterized protein n=1 Tax=Thermaerobacillus caldiproteolyticus TaxID=247480 RepID=A0A7V9Z5X1_9BACL|nr:hypothetical protein [Anoxybacillus caldiproteolyticus]MBA2874576.1 hypothetical protein [Anoxybacillus caldiproteolyticus]
MDEFIKVLNHYPNGTKLIIEWKDGLRIKGLLDTIYETDNGLELEDEDYDEYFACALKILSIENNPSGRVLSENTLLEVSKQNKPSKIFLENGVLIWQDMNDK